MPVPGGAHVESGLAEKSAFIVHYDDGEADTAYAAGSRVGKLARATGPEPFLRNRARRLLQDLQHGSRAVQPVSFGR